MTSPQRDAMLGSFAHEAKAARIGLPYLVGVVGRCTQSGGHAGCLPRWCIGIDRAPAGSLVRLDAAGQPARDQIGDLIPLPVPEAVPPGRLELCDRTLSLHLLFLGVPGSGKTNGTSQVVSRLLERMEPEDRMVIFDTKGDYLRRFYNPNHDFVLALAQLTPEATGGKVPVNQVRWNLFRDILVDSEDERTITAGEVSRTLFDEAVRQSSQPFFPKSAQNVTRAVLLALLRKARSARLSHPLLKETLSTGKAIMDAVEGESDLSHIQSFIGQAGTESQGILTEIQLLADYVFTGTFAEEGGFAVRDFVLGRVAPPRKGPSVLFLEYDVGTGLTVQPIYRVIMDLIIKECLSRRAHPGRTFIIIDEFALLPNLYYIEQGINFGRELGLRFLIGTQNVDQVMAAYPGGRGGSILASFGTVLSFRLQDPNSRKLVESRRGVLETSVRIPGYIHGQQGQRVLHPFTPVDDYQLSTLPDLEAIVQYPEHDPLALGSQPFLFRFNYVVDGLGRERDRWGGPPPVGPAGAG